MCALKKRDPRDFFSLVRLHQLYIELRSIYCESPEEFSAIIDAIASCLPELRNLQLMNKDYLCYHSLPHPVVCPQPEKFVVEATCVHRGNYHITDLPLHLSRIKHLTVVQW